MMETFYACIAYIHSWSFPDSSKTCKNFYLICIILILDIIHSHIFKIRLQNNLIYI
jgi:hypothetical protein